jgi:hypothetical protein
MGRTRREPNSRHIRNSMDSRWTKSKGQKGFRYAWRVAEDASPSDGRWDADPLMGGSRVRPAAEGIGMVIEEVKRVKTREEMDIVVE